MLARCPACSERFPIAGGGELSCPFCRATLVVSIELATSAPIEPLLSPHVKNRAGTAWEERGRIKGFLLTLGAVLRSPIAFFRELSTGAVGRAPSFALLILIPALAQLGALLLVRKGGPFDVETIVRHTGLIAVASLLSLAFVGTFYQLAASLFAGRRVAVPGTVRALCFGLAPMIFAIVPVAGLAIGLCWSLLLHAIALREIHGLTSLKSFAVVLFPIAVVAVRLW